jgi:hypothetical protein
MMANKKLTVSDALRINFNVGLGHFRAPVCIQGIRKNAHLLVFQQRIRCPRFKMACRKQCMPGKYEELHNLSGRPVACPWVFLAGCFLSFQPCLL